MLAALALERRKDINRLRNPRGPFATCCGDADLHGALRTGLARTSPRLVFNVEEKYSISRSSLSKVNSPALYDDFGRVTRGVTDSRLLFKRAFKQPG